LSSPNSESRILAPIVILVRPQMGENIGAVARAMSNFGLSELRLVAPRDGWPNSKAKKTASGAESLIESAKLYPDFTSAIADIHIAYATTARPRDMEKRVVEPEEAMREISAMIRSSDHPIIGSAIKTALVFGPERAGLENEEITWCDTLITIPTAENHSLNLAQSAVILGYEWRKRSGEWLVASGEEEKESKETTHHSPLATRHLATLQNWQGLFNQLESYLDEINYYRVAHKKPAMWQNLKTMLLRARFSDQEVRTFRGMLRSLWERRVRNEDNIVKTKDKNDLFYD